MSEIPLALKLWLTLTIIATLMGIYLLYRTIIVWKAGSLAGSWARIRFTVVTKISISDGNKTVWRRERIAANK